MKNHKHPVLIKRTVFKFMKSNNVDKKNSTDPTTSVFTTVTVSTNAKR